MSAVIGALRAELSASIAKFQEDMGKAAREVEKFASRTEKQGKRIEGVGRKMSIALTLPLAAFARQSLRAGKESAQALAQVEATLASTGNTAGKTAAELQKSAKALEKMSTFDDDDILKEVTANLLAFGTVQGEVFDRAQRAIVDLSAKMGGDLQSNTLKLGKALEDPVHGLMALEKAGVKFSGEEKEQLKTLVKHNDVLGAHALILAKVESKVAGSAAAMRKNDPFAAMAQSFRELEETAAPIIVGILEPLVALVKSLADGFVALSPFMQKVVIGFLAFLAAVGPIVGLIGNLITLVAWLAPLLAPIGVAIAGISLATWGWIAAIAAAAIALVILGKFIKNVFEVGFAKAWDNAKATAKNMWDDLSGIFKKKPIEVPVHPVIAGGPKGKGPKFGASAEQIAASKALDTSLKAMQDKVNAAFSKLTIPASVAAAKDLNNQLDDYIAKAKEAGVGTAGFANRIAGLRQQIEAYKQAALAKEAQKFTRAVDENDIAVRRFAAGGLDPLAEKLDTIDNAYQSLRDKIEAQIEDNRVLAESNDGAAAAMKRLEEQLIKLGAAHDKATAGARALYAAENHLRDLQTSADISSTQEQITDLKRARGQGAPISSDMEKAQQIARELAQQQQQAEIKLADLRTQSIQAQTIGDTEELARINAQIDAQTELADLLQNTTAEQLHDAARINEAFKNFADNLSDTLGDLIDNWNGDISSLYDVFKQLARQLFMKPFLDEVSGGIAGFMKGGMSSLFGGGGRGAGGLGEAFGGGDFVGTSSDRMAGGGLLSGIGSLFSGWFADGGFVPPGRWGMAGENGPEPVIGGHSGARVMSNADAQQAFGGKGTTVQQNFRIGRMDKDTFKPTRRQFARIAKGAIG